MFRTLPVVERAMAEVHSGIPYNAIGIHGKIYDVDGFAKWHPGGEALIEVARGQDCTALFESHHVDIDRATRALSSLRVVGEYDKVAHLDFTRYDKLRRKVLPLLLRKKVGFHARLERLAWTVAMVGLQYALCVVPVTLTAWWWWSMLMLSAVVNTVCGAFGHNAVHRVQPEAILLDWNGLSSFEWLLEHVSSHHMYTNSSFDHDAISMEPFIVWHKKTSTTTTLGTKDAATTAATATSQTVVGTAERKRDETGGRASLVNKVGMHAIFLVSELVVAFNGMFVHRSRWSILGNGAFPIWMRLAPLLVPLRLSTLVASHGLWLGTVAFAGGVGMAGYMFALMAHLNHTPASYHDYSTPSVDFVNAQLTSTRDIHSSTIPSVDLGLDRQTLHHLFPSIDHSLLTDDVRNTVREFVEDHERPLLCRRDGEELYRDMCRFVS